MCLSGYGAHHCCTWFNQLIGWSSSQSFGAAILCLCWVRNLTRRGPACVRVLDLTVRAQRSPAFLGRLLWAIPDITHTIHHFNKNLPTECETFPEGVVQNL